VLAGGAFAAVSATGQSNGHERHAHRRGPHGPRHLRPQDLQAAADYLGVSTDQLTRELGSSRSLAQIADAHSGKSAQGLTEAIIASRKARLGKLASRLPKRIGAEVARTGRGGAGASGKGGSAAQAQGLSRLGLFTAAGHLGSAAADYLGLTPAQLRGQLQSGKTLAQLAEATPGKSKAGLIDALVAAKQERLAGKLAKKRLTQARAARKAQRLHKRVELLLARKFATR
jgi:hypothetical protein